MHRSKAARLALSGLAVPLFVTSFFFVGLPGASVVPAMVTAAIVMLWFQPARDWYDGIVREAPAPPPPLAAPTPADRADRPGPAARPPAAERAAAAPHAVRRPADAATARPRGDPRR